MSRWTRRRTVIGGRVCAEDWSVRLDGVAVGRVSWEDHGPHYRTWTWAAYNSSSGPSRGYGKCGSLDEGLELVRAAVIEAGGIEALPGRRRPLPPRDE